MHKMGRKKPDLIEGLAFLFIDRTAHPPGCGVKKQPAPGWDRLFFIMHNSLYDNVHHQATYPFTGRTAHLPGYGSLTYVRN